MSNLLHYVLDYGCFALGAILYILSKIQEYKDMADANPDPKITYSAKKFLNKEAINFVRLFIGGFALIIFSPMLVGGAVVDVKNADGAVMFSISMKTALMPLYFTIGLGGTALLFSVLGRYKKTLLSKLPPEENRS